MKKMMNVVLVIKAATRLIPIDLMKEVESIVNNDGNMELFIEGGNLQYIGMCKLEEVKERFAGIKEKFGKLELESNFHSFEVSAINHDGEIADEVVVDLTRIDGRPTSGGSTSLKMLICDSDNGNDVVDVFIDTLSTGRAKLGRSDRKEFNIAFNRVNRVFFDDELRLIDKNTPKEEMNVDIVIDRANREIKDIINIFKKEIISSDGDCVLFIRHGSDNDEIIGRCNYSTIKKLFHKIVSETNLSEFKEMRLLIKTHDRSVYESCEDQIKHIHIRLPWSNPSEYVRYDLTGAGNRIEEREYVAKHLTNAFVDNKDGDTDLFLNYGYGATTYLGKCKADKVENTFSKINKKYYNNELKISY